MLSMTGFAAGQAALGQGQVHVEIRALNHRFVDVRVRVPNELAEHAFFLEQLARQRLARGRYDIGVRLEGHALPSPEFALDRARAAYHALSMLRDELAPGTELPLSSVALVPDVLVPTTNVASEPARAALKVAFLAAVERLEAMRRAEGQALRDELLQRLAAARSCRKRIADRSCDMSALYLGRLRERLTRLLEDVAVPLDHGRLETEIALIADRGDLTEELVRLSCHFEQFEQLLGQDEPIGRRLDFLLQEMAREANTTGAKSQDAPLAHLVVELKAEIERMREQVQNVQ